MQPLNAKRHEEPLSEEMLLDNDIDGMRLPTPLITTGFDPLDRLISISYTGLMYVMGAQPGMGKTTLAVEIADCIAAQGHPVLFVTQELPRPRLLAKSIVRLSSGNLTLSNISEAISDDSSLHSKLLEAKERYRKTIAPNMFYTTVDDIAEVDRLVSDIRNQYGHSPIIFIDYLQILAACTDATYMDERLAIAGCVKHLRNTCNAYETTIFAISSITRGAYGGKGLKKASASLDIYAGTSAVEYSFDGALYLSADSERAAPNGMCPVNISTLKNRYGELGSISLDFDGAHAVFHLAQ
ncbi:DnaB-like helicase C-terminal domain-containing protein [Atopobiaceae bacterium HCP3S3_A4]